MFDLSAFRLQDMALCSTTIRQLGEGATSIEEVADRITRFLYTTLTAGPDEDPACVLIRAFKTHPYNRLTPELQALVDTRLGNKPANLDLKCLTLLASTGAISGWNNPALSSRFRVIPLAEPDALAQLPMFAQLFAQFHLDVPGIQDTPTSLLLDQRETTFNAFHVPQAVNSPYVPGQQDFVVPFGVQSVFGCGGLLPTGDMFALVLFAKTPVSKDTADLFKAIALSVKLALAPFEHSQLILPTTTAVSGSGNIQEPVTLTALQDRIATLEAILAVQEHAVEAQSRRLEDNLAESVRQRQQLQKQSMRFETLSATSPVGIFETDAKGSYLYTNDTWQAITSLSLTDSLGDGWSRAIVEEDRSHVFAAWNQTAQTGGDFSLELRMQRPDGAVRWVHVRSRPLKNEAEQVTGHVGTTEDITERKQAEEALRQSETQYRTLFESSHDAIMVLAPPTWKFKAGNAATIRMFRAQDEADFISHGPGDLSPERQPDGRLSADMAGELIGIAMREGSHSFEWTHRRLTGEPFPSTVLLTRIELSGELQLQATVRDITEHKRAEATLRQSEERYRRYFELGLIGMAVTSLEKGWVQVNDRLCEIFGYSHDELLTKTWTELTHPDDMVQDLAQFNRVLGGEIDSYAMDKRFIRKDGRVIHASISVGAVRRDDGTADHFVALVQDVTARHEAEERLKENERRLQQQIDEMPIGHIVWDCNFQVKAWNPAAERIFGYPSIEAIGRHVSFLIPEAFRSSVEDLQQRLIDGDRTAHSTNDNLTKDGRRITCQWAHTPLRDARGQIAGAFSMVQDVTEQQRYQTQLRQTEERWTYAFEGNGDGVWDWDTQTNSVFFSNRWKEMLGYAGDEIGATFEEWSSRVHPDDLATAMANIQRHFRGETPVYVNEHRMRCKDGSYKWILDRGKAISRAPDGFPLRVVLTHSDITIQKAFEKALEEGHCLQDSILANAVHAIIATDPHGIITSFNPAAEHMLGYRADEIIGILTPAMFHDPEEVMARAEQFGAELGIVLAPGFDVLVEKSRRGLPNQHEWTYVSKDGARIPVLLGISELRSSSGVLIGYLEIAIDLSERKRAEAALTASEERLRLTLDIATDGIWDWDLSTLQAFYSPRWISLLGLEDHEIPLNNVNDWKSRIHPDDRPQVEQALAAHLAGQSASFNVDHRIRHRSGIWKWFTMHGQVTHRDHHGHPRRMMGVLNDITERKQTEVSQFRLQQAINHAQDGMALLDEAGEFTYMNPAHASIYGYTADELLGKHWTQLYPEEWAAMIDRMFLPMLRSEGQWQGEVVGKKQSGDAFHVDLALTLLKETGTGQHTILCTCRDITHRKRIERDLIDAKEAAEAGARTKSDFLATMSHEIRTPMNGVLGMTNLLIDTPLTPEQQDLVQTLKLSGESLMRIINDILDFSKIESGKFTIESIPFDLRPTIEDTLDLLAPAAQAKQLELTGLIDGQAPNAVIGDPGRIRQILTNLIGNAIKFTEQGEILVQVLKAEEQPDSVLLRFDIVDTGVGLTEEATAKLFQAFTQADSSTARKYGGTGLGLTICKRLTELMGGRIGIQSYPGTGTRVWFTIQLRTQPATAALPTLAPVDSLRGLRICLVDDNATNRSLLQYHASDWKMLYESAEDGPSALALIRRAAAEGKPFDLAILDMHMPGMDGLELGRAITSDANLSRTRLILLTALGRRGDAKLAHTAGFSGYLTKPVRKLQLYDCLRLVMGQAPPSSIERQAAPSQTPLITRHQVAEVHAQIRLLVVDDNPVNQKVAVKLLEKLGYPVDVAGNGNEALAALTRYPSYRLIFMDCQMPELDGFEATQMIRSHEQPGTRLPIIAMTANAMEGDRERCLAAGMDDFVSKPITAATLKTVLGRWLSGDSEPAYGSDNEARWTAA